jgi:hypothetical protein
MTQTAKAPLHAQFLSIFWGLLACLALLRFFHILPTRHPHAFGPEHLIFHQFLSISGPTLELLGAMFLWRMRPIAAMFFAANLTLAICAAIYLSLISPDSQMLILQKKSYYVLFSVIGFVYTAGQYLYVWWVTSLRKPAKAKAEPSTENNSQAPAAAKLISILYLLAACVRLLVFFHILPARYGLHFSYAEHPLTSQFALLTSAAILLPGAVFLWKLRPIAAKLFLVYLLLSASLTIYLTYISPDTQMLQGYPFFSLLRFVIAAAVCTYAWWVTSPREPTVNS